MDRDRLEALRLSEGLQPTAKHISRVAGQTTSEAASWAFTQWDLRRRALAKFPMGSQMLFDRDGLEMASSSQIASLHAGLFPHDSRVADLTCGIGGDLIALASRGPAVGFELDPERAEMARWNLEASGLSSEIRIEDCLNADWDFDCAFADPARRSGGRRTLDADSFEPPLRKLAERMESLEFGVIKLSPMLSDDLLEGLRGQVSFISMGRECREAVVAVGRGAPGEPIADARSFRAVHVESGVSIASGPPVPDAVDEPLAVLLEADPAAIRAHALGTLCDLGGLLPLGSSNGYLTAESLEQCDTCDAWVRAFFVLSFGKGDERTIATDLRRLDAHITDVKSRGLRTDPAAWKRRLRSAGPRPVVLILYPVEHSVRYTLVEPAVLPGKSA